MAKQDLTKITVNLTARAVQALEMAAQLTGDSKTDTVNRAIQVYAFLMHATKEEGKDIYLMHGEEADRIEFL